LYAQLVIIRKNPLLKILYQLQEGTIKTLQIGLEWFPEGGGGLERVYYDCIRYLGLAEKVSQFWILDFGFWIDPIKEFGGLEILDFEE
jgi:hypothetical protein